MPSASRYIVALVFALTQTLCIWAHPSPRKDKPSTPQSPDGSQKSSSTTWPNPCSANGGQTDGVCGFLIDRFREIDSRCGIVYKVHWYTPWKKTDPWEIIPQDVFQDSTIDWKDASDKSWILLKRPSLVKLLSYVIDSSDVAADAMDKPYLDPSGTNQNPKAKIFTDRAEQLIPNLKALSFNPMLDPDIVFDIGRTNLIHNLTCTDAFTFKEDGKANFSLIGTAEERFQVVQNSNATLKLVAGTFQSPIAFERDNYPDTFYFEVLDIYARYNRARTSAQTVPLADLKLYYLEEVEGIIVYNTLKGALDTGLNGNAQVGASALTGSINAEADGSRSHAQNIAAHVFYSYIRPHDSSIQALPSLDYIHKKFQNLSNPLVSSVEPNGKPAVWNSNTRRVEASISVEGMPHSLCGRGLWAIDHPSFNDLKIEDPFYVNGSSKSGIRSPSACVWKISSEKASSNLSGSLSYADTDIGVKMPFDVSYKIDRPSFQFLSSDLQSSGNKVFANSWYQVLSPQLLDVGKTMELNDGWHLSCDKNSPSASDLTTASIKNSYEPPAGGTKLTGTFLLVQIQWKNTTPPTACTLSGSVGFTTGKGIETSAGLPTN